MSPEEGGDLVQGSVEDGGEAMSNARIGVQLRSDEPIDRAPQQCDVGERIRLSRQEEHRAPDAWPMRCALVPRLAPPRRVERIREQDEGGYRPVRCQQRCDAAAERMPTDDGGRRLLVVERGAVDPDGTLGAPFRELDEAHVEAARDEAALVLA